MGKIQIVQGKFDETTTFQNNLTANQVKYPDIQKVIQYAEPRMLSTLIVSGYGQTDYNMGKMKTKIGTIPASDLIGSSGYKYLVQGRLQKASIILGLVDTPTTGGVFSLRMKDNYLTPGMVAVFNSGILCRVLGLPTGSEGNFIYSFQTVGGTQFVYATDVALQNGEKTCFGSYSSFSEGSLTGYSRGHYAEWFINHMTIQRKTIGITGSAASDVLWALYDGFKGWYFKKERDAKIQFKIEDEFQKWFGESNMKNADGTAKDSSGQFDSATGNEIIQGDGIIAQIKGINEIDGSGVNGVATIEDINDMMTTLEKRSSSYEGKVWYVVTGTDGFRTFQDLLEDKQANKFNIQITKDGSLKPGGPDVQVGYNFMTYNYAGNQLILIKHTLFDDEQRFTAKGVDGKILQSSQMIFLDMSPADGISNIEIKSKGAYGINRAMQSVYLNGPTGMNMGNVVTGVDSLEYHMLKEDMVIIYNTRSCGIINKSAA